MKKILFALAIMPLLIVACSSDDDDNTTPKNDFDYTIELLYGEWRATSVEFGGASFDLTDPVIEMMVEPTYLTFEKNGSYSSKGVLGEGTGKYIAKEKTITATADGKALSLNVTSLSATTSKVEVNAKALGLPMIPEGVETVTVVLTKDYVAKIDFDHNIEMLYGEWRATSVEGVGEEAIDLTNPAMEMIVAPTYITFNEEGVYTSKGILGEGTGKYTTKGKTIFTIVGEETFNFDMTSLSAETAKIEVDAKDLGLSIIPQEIGTVTVVLTKQVK